MRFITHNDDEINVTRTVLVGQVKCYYYKLVEILGEPANQDGMPNWDIQFDDGTVATLYGWNVHFKDRDVNRVWNVGGKSATTLWKVYDLVNQENNFVNL